MSEQRTSVLSDAARLDRLEAFEAIRQCVFRYALAGDRGNDGKITRTLFTESASFEAAGFGSFQGRDAIVQGLEAIARDTVKWAFHIPGGPLITVAGDVQTATAFWWAWIPVTLRQDGKDVPVWGAGNYSADLVRTEQGWQFQRLLLEPKFQTPFTGPWTVL
jgi:hypothetical protein